MKSIKSDKQTHTYTEADLQSALRQAERSANKALASIGTLYEEVTGKKMSDQYAFTKIK